jgi:hypothetical protein
MKVGSWAVKEALPAAVGRSIEEGALAKVRARSTIQRPF